MLVLIVCVGIDLLEVSIKEKGAQKLPGTVNCPD